MCGCDMKRLIFSVRLEGKYQCYFDFDRQLSFTDIEVIYIPGVSVFRRLYFIYFRYHVFLAHVHMAIIISVKYVSLKKSCTILLSLTPVGAVVSALVL